MNMRKELVWVSTALAVLPLALSAPDNLDLTVDLLTHLGNEQFQLLPIGVGVMNDGAVAVAANAPSSALESEMSEQTVQVQLMSVSEDSDEGLTKDDGIIGNASLIVINRDSDGQRSITDALSLIDTDNESSNRRFLMTGLSVCGFNVFAQGTFGVMYLRYLGPSQGFSKQWYSKDLACPSLSEHCGVDCDDGEFAVSFINDGTFDQTIGVYRSSDGTVIKKLELINQVKQISDIIVDSQSKLALFTGYNQPGTDLKTPLITAVEIDDGLSSNEMTVKYTLYDGDEESINAEGLGSDATGEVLALNRSDDNTEEERVFLFVGRADGGESVFRRDASDITVDADNRGYDSYTIPSNIGNQPEHYASLFRLNDGSQLHGQFMITRRSGGQGNSLSPCSAAFHGSHDLVFAQNAACCVDSRDQLSIQGESVADYAGFPDGLFMQTQREMESRVFWHSLTKDAAKSKAEEIASHNGVMAMVGSVRDGGGIVEVNHLDGSSQIDDSDGQSGYLLIRDEWQCSRDCSNPYSQDSGAHSSRVIRSIHIWLAITLIFSALH